MNDPQRLAYLNARRLVVGDVVLRSDLLDKPTDFFDCQVKGKTREVSDSQLCLGSESLGNVG